jgi:cell division protein FtsB
MKLTEKIERRLGLLSEDKESKMKALHLKKDRLEHSIEKLKASIKDMRDDKSDMHPSAANDESREKIDRHIKATQKKISQLEDELDEIGADMHDLEDEEK